MRRAQISIFIIAALVLLLGTIISIAIYQDWLRYKPPEEQVIAETNVELQPFRNLIEQCQQDILDEGVRLALSTGGYIDPRSSGVIPLVPPYGKAAGASGERGIAYWHHTHQGQFTSERPPLNGTEAHALNRQLESYVDARLLGCADPELLPQYEISFGEPQSSVRFVPGRVIITTHLPTTVVAQTATAEYESYQATLDAPVLDLYEATESAVDHLRDSRMPEWYTLEWLSYYATGRGNIPPMYGGERMTSEYRVWPLGPAIPDVQEVIHRMASHIAFIGSRELDVLITDDERINQLYLEGQVPVGDAQTVAMNAYYRDSAGIHYAIDGNRGAAVPRRFEPPATFRLFIDPIVDNTFGHDITYPLIIRSEQDGYSLHAAYEVNIQGNVPQQPYEDDGAAFCENAGGATLRITADAEGSVIYTCGSDSCLLGDTRGGQLTATAPACAVGTVDLISEEGFVQPQTVSSTAGETVDVALEVHAPRTVAVEILAREAIPQSGGAFALSQTTAPITAEVIFIRQGTPLVSTVVDGAAELAPGTYEVYVLRTEEFSPPLAVDEQLRCVDGDGWLIFRGEASINDAETQLGLTEEDEDCFLVERLEFPSLMTAYLALEGDDALVLESVPDTLTLKAASMDPTRLVDIEDLALLGAVFELGEGMEQN